jgi:ABC-type lipoprotein release transport system permease subunit
MDPLTFTAVPLVLGLAAVAASYLPALRASGVNPVEALRAE